MYKFHHVFEPRMFPVQRRPSTPRGPFIVFNGVMSTAVGVRYTVILAGYVKGCRGTSEFLHKFTWMRGVVTVLFLSQKRFWTRKHVLACTLSEGNFVRGPLLCRGIHGLHPVLSSPLVFIGPGKALPTGCRNDGKIESSGMYGELRSSESTPSESFVWVHTVHGPKKCLRVHLVLFRLP